VDARAILSDKPLQNVHIVAGLLNDHRSTFFAVSPISANEGVALVNVSDTFGVLNVDDITNLSRIYQIFECDEERSESQNVTYEHENSLVLCRKLNGPAFLGRCTHRLFEKQIVSLFNGGKSGSQVVSVHRRDNNEIGKFRTGKQVFPRGVAKLFGDTKGVSDVVSSCVYRLGNCNDLKAANLLYGKLRIAGSSASCTDNDDFFHNF